MRCMQNTRMAARTEHAGKKAADNSAPDHIVGMVVKARAAMAQHAEAIGAYWAKYGK
jgi:hypothetical protein